jgi:hypothetical protein
LLVFLISVIYFEGELGCYVVGGGVSLGVLVSVILCKSTLFMFLTIVLISADGLKVDIQIFLERLFTSRYDLVKTVITLYVYLK